MHKFMPFLFVLILFGGCAISDTRMTASSKTFKNNEALDNYSTADLQGMPVSKSKVYLKGKTKWCAVGSGHHAEGIEVPFSMLAGRTYPIGYRLQGDKLETMIRSQLDSLGMNLVNSEAEADFVLTMKLEHKDIDIVIENAPTILSLFMLYPLTMGDACMASGQLIDRRSGRNEVVIAFDSWEGAQKGEKPIRTDSALHVTPLAIVVHTPINYIFKKDLLEANTYLDNQVANGYVSRVYQLMQQGMFY